MFKVGIYVVKNVHHPKASRECVDQMASLIEVAAIWKGRLVGWVVELTPSRWSQEAGAKVGLIASAKIQNKMGPQECAAQ